mgnify:CR=1 FL=1
MKKYFAKYLPVEGDIELGDIIWDNVIEKFVEYDDIEAFPDINQMKKYQLFLCSRDLILGDKIFVEPQALELEEKGITFSFISSKDGYSDFKYETHPTLPKVVGSIREGWPTSNIYKSIGPISSEAIWIKEYDEFDEDQIEMWDYDQFMYEFIAPRNGQYDDMYDLIVKIKCSQCQTFH